MRKKQPKQKPQNRRELAVRDSQDSQEVRVKLLRAQSENQQLMINATYKSHLVFASGPAGTGKTYIAVSRAIDMLLAGNISQIVLTRAKVPAGEDYGHLPGEIDEKMAPYLAPFKQIMEERLGIQQMNRMIQCGQIIAIPLGFLQGLTFNYAAILIDEAENCTAEQIRLISTRLGHNSVAFFMGDEKQCYIRNSGFMKAIQILESLHIVSVIRFTIADVVRSETCRLVLEAYEKAGEC
jgi:phosphate starvation-inducible PhoH-like protein